MLEIGNIVLEQDIVAAPLAGISNPVYRRMMREYGAGLCVSEMISDKALHYKNERTFDMCRIFPDEHPVSLQLFGGDPETMAEASKYLTENTDCDIIDINMGCPVPKVLKAHSGSWLLQYPDLAYDIVKAVKDNTDRPVTVKIRAGYDSAHINCDTFAKKLEQAGADAIAIHGRTRSQMYHGQSDNTYIRMVKENVSIPVIGNGDIVCAADMVRMKEETHCDGVMVGRGLLGRPFLLQELIACEKNLPYTEPTAYERIALCIDYAEKLCAYDPRNGIHQMRGMSGWFLSGIPFSAQYRNRLCSVNTLDELKEILQEFTDTLQESSL